MNRIQELYAIGQSIWLDYIERDMLASGELAALVDSGLSGVTSNPSIFQAAITGSSAYDDEIRTLAAADHDAKTIFEHLAVADIQAAADTLHPVYERAQGHDGFVSLEVAPDLANDTTATIAEARRLHSMVGKPNVMIKVPATRAGIPAIERLIADGININVTLIFSLERYAAVKEAFIKGLESRRAQQLPIDRIASVASFFISRVDVNIDQRLADRDDGQELMGAIAIANAKLAYAQFQRVFDGARWQSLVAEGARVQRPLWASTSTKNPDYPDLLYVDTLIGPHTVNTVPPKTLEAIQDHGTIARTIDRDLDSAQRQMVALAALGIDIDEVTQELEVEGVQKFADSYDALLEAIEEQRKVLAAGQAS